MFGVSWAELGRHPGKGEWRDVQRKCILGSTKAPKAGIGRAVYSSKEQRASQQGWEGINWERSLYESWPELGISF